MTSHVTNKPKCYVFVCVGCGLLASSERSDAVSCSIACRVKAHRSGKLKKLREFAEVMDVPVAMIQQAAAIHELAPDIGAELLSGKRRKIDAEVRQIVWVAFRDRVKQAVRATP